MPNRFIHTDAWDSFEEQGFSQAEKFVFIYVCTSPSSRPSGLFKCTLRSIEKATGFDRETIASALADLARRGTLTYEAPLVFVPQFAKWQKAGKMKGWEGHLSNTRSELCHNGNKASLAFEDFYFNPVSVTIPYEYPMDTS